jgi:glycogen(starch) synthase
MRVLLQHMHKPGEISGVVTFVELAASALRELGIEARIFPSSGAGWSDCRRAVSECDLVHLNSNEARLWACARISRKPILQMYHYPFWGGDVPFPGNRPRTLFRSFWATVQYRANNAGDQVWKWWFIKYATVCHVRTISRLMIGRAMDERIYATQFMVENAALPWSGEVCPLGIDFQDSEIKPPPINAKFLYLGRVDHQKGVDTLLRSVAMLRDEGVSCSVDVVGSGAQLEEIQKLRIELGLQNQIIIHGRLPRERAMEMMESALALIVPSRWNEPTGYVILEAASKGRVSIASRRGGIPEVIGPGLLFESEDAKGLAAHMRRLIENPQEAADLGLKAYEEARKNFSSAQMAKRLAVIYERLLRK